MRQPIMVTAHCVYRKRPRGEFAAQLPSLELTAFGNTEERARGRLRFLLGNLLQRHRQDGTLEDFLELHCHPSGGDSYLLARREGPPAPERHPARRVLQRDVEGWSVLETPAHRRRVTAGA